MTTTYRACACRVPKEIIAAMVQAGADKDELKGQGMRVIKIDEVGSKAWKVYEKWADSLGDVSPLVQANFCPPLTTRPDKCSPVANGLDTQFEASNIIGFMASLRIEDCAGGTPAFPYPLPETIGWKNVRNAAVAVTAVIQAISDPGATCPKINALPPGFYICHLSYVWHGTIIVIPVFRL